MGTLSHRQPRQRPGGRGSLGASGFQSPEVSELGVQQARTSKRPETLPSRNGDHVAELPLGDNTQAWLEAEQENVLHVNEQGHGWRGSAVPGRDRERPAADTAAPLG